MRVKASTILKACYDRQREYRLSYRIMRKGFPKIEVIWDVPKTSENVKLVEDFIRDVSPETSPVARCLKWWIEKGGF